VRHFHSTLASRRQRVGRKQSRWTTRRCHRRELQSPQRRALTESNKPLLIITEEIHRCDTETRSSRGDNDVCTAGFKMPDNFVFWIRSLAEISSVGELLPEGWAFTIQVVVVDTFLYLRHLIASRTVTGICFTYRQTFALTWHPRYGGLLTYQNELDIDVLTPSIPPLLAEHLYVYAFHIYVQIRCPAKKRHPRSSRQTTTPSHDSRS
jgi:hypothetical protein